MIDCCKVSSKNKKCVRQDGKVFTFPRRFSKKQCLNQPIRGFTMRSSCAPFLKCKSSSKKKIKKGGSRREKMINKKKEKKTHKKKKQNKKRHTKRNKKKEQQQEQEKKRKLKVCSLNPVTGYFRDGLCRTDSSDFGKHLVCATITSDFLEYSKSKGNDLTSVVSPGQNWCLCESRWEEAYDNGNAPPVVLDATSHYVSPKIKSKINKFMKSYKK